MSVAIDSTSFAVRSEQASHRHALAPVLLGLLAPMLLFLLIDPRAATDASLITHVYMFTIFFIATGAFLISVFETGVISSVSADRSTKTFTIERTGLLAKSEMKIAFADVATVRIETRYDDDGYQTAMPVLVLTTREILQLPADTTEADVAKLKAMLRPS